MTDIDALKSSLLEGTRRSLARAITLVETTHPDKAREGQALLEAVLHKTGGSVRLGISGTPGVGKSTFIEALGLSLIEAGLTVAVLAVDPSSPLSGGSILGDKTRMEELGRKEQAFIRPSPSAGALGGVARRTREAMLLCEAAGFDVVIVETVGVGQSEVEVASMVDTFLLLLQPASGDALQGVKRGVLELADLAVVNKADGVLLQAAERTRQQYELGLALIRPTVPGWKTPVRTVSALEQQGLPAVWADVNAHRQIQEEQGLLADKRAAQAERWMWAVLREELDRRLQHGAAAAEVQAAIAQVRKGALAPTRAAWDLLERLYGERT